ncbi:MAG: NUDIX domain-containing protein [Hyphomicrobiales bacterium]|nr:NUDIX domain-containing protein [Hyphomicrobiales bacterium]
MDADKKTRRDVEVVERTNPYAGYFRIDRYRLRHRLFEGGWSGEMTREVFERGHAAAALLYDPDLDRLVFIEQFRVGAFAALNSPWYAEDDSPWLIECIAGIIEAGEDPEGVVRREAVEEAGCEIREIVPITHYLATPGGSTESVFLFCGRVDSRGVEGVHGLSEEHENIRVFTVSADEALAMLDRGDIINAMTLIPLYWFRGRRDALRRAWAGIPAGDGQGGREGGGGTTTGP